MSEQASKILKRMEEIERLIKDEGVTRPNFGGKRECPLCLREFESVGMLDYFKVDLPPKVMKEMFGDEMLPRYGWSFCDRCYFIMDVLHQEMECY